MSGIFREVLTFPQRTGDIRLVVIGDEKYARYETLDGFTVIYEPERDEYVYAALSDFGQFVATDSPASGPPPPRTPQHLMEAPEVRSFIRKERFVAMLPSGPPGGAAETAREDDRMFTFGPSGGLLPGRQLTSGNVVGLTILVTFPDTTTSTTVSEVDALLNAANYRGNGNFASVNGYFKLMSSGKLNYTNRVVGPFQLSRPRMFYSLKVNEGKLVPEVLQLALNANVDFSQFDSQGENIVDALSIMYAGQTIYQGDLWPHNWVHDTDVGQGIRTELYTITSMGTVLLSSGTPGKRYAMPNSTIHMHQVLGGASGQAADIEIEAREAIRLNELLRRILATNTGQSEERIKQDADRNYYMTSQQAKDYGMIDEILLAAPRPVPAISS